ncbi:MAG: hypothetical protein K2X38_08685 [Gemmataceae bacterium]|nr:hypothetical protein [Gemmataceae bacterium]
MSDLSFFSTQELIDELVSRKTFLGVIVHAEEEHRTKEWRGDKYFDVRFNKNLHEYEAMKLLDVVSDFMDREMC